MKKLKYLLNKFFSRKHHNRGTEDSSTLRDVRRVFGRSAISPVRKIASLSLLLFSALCLIYWFACLLAAGGGISELWIWPAAAVAFLLLFLWTSKLPPLSRLRQKKWLRIIVAAMLAVLLCLFVTVECFIISHMNDSGTPGLDYIIVLGAHVRGTVPSSALLWRIERAYEYLNANPDTVAIVSGGQGRGEDISEAECMRRELVSRGIPTERILIEDKSTSTIENITLSLEIIDDIDAQIGIVTNNFHVWRAVRVLDNSGVVNAYGIAAPYKNLLLFHYMVREFFSVIINNLSGKM